MIITIFQLAYYLYKRKVTIKQYCEIMTNYFISQENKND